VSNERLEVVKNCCLAITELPADRRALLLVQIATRARDRQRSCLSPMTSPTQQLDSLDSNYLPRRTVAAFSTTTTTTTAYSAVPLIVRHGITNLGNTCYIAVSLQIIASLKARSSNAVTLRAVNAVMDARRGKAKNPYVPSDGLVRSLSLGLQNPYDQQFAIHCIESFLDRNVDSLYTSVMLHQDCTCKCGSHSYSSSLLNVLHVASDGLLRQNLQDAIKSCCFEDTQVHLTCDCGSTAQLKSISLADTGPFLIISFKRAQSGNTRSFTQVNTDLVMWIAKLEYRLAAVVLHYGDSTDSGHYTCLVEDDGWLHCDDSRVTLIDDVDEFLKANDRYSVLWLYARQELPVIVTRSLTKSQMDK